MAIDGISGRVYMDQAIPGINDIPSTPTQTTVTNSSGTKDFPSLTPAESAANAKAAGAKPSSSSSTDPLTGAAGGALGKTAFLQLLVQEMTNQDPLKPADNTEFIAQLAQFSTLEQMQNMNDGFTKLQNSIQAGEARGMLGVAVKAVDSSTGANIEGVVDQIILNADGSVRVDVNGTPVNLADIVSIGSGAAASANGTSGAQLPGTLVPGSGTGSSQ